MRAQRRPVHDSTSSFGLAAGGYREVLAALADATHLMVYSGSGLSADSGLPTYRGEGKRLWTDDALERVCTLPGFASNFQYAQRWHDVQALRLSMAQPHAGHRALAEAEQTWDVSHVTQNVDRLLERAGAHHVVHVHGVFDEARCMQCGAKRRGAWRPLSGASCSECQARTLRPQILFMSEVPDEATWLAAQHCAAQASLVLVVGTPAEMYPGAGLVEQAHARGVPVLVINPEWCENLHYARWQLFGTAREVLPTLLREARIHRQQFRPELQPSWLTRARRSLRRSVARWARLLRPHSATATL